MKKKLLVGALSGIFSTLAYAQSSITLYGIIDTGITYTNNQNGHSNWQQSAGAINGNRWGLRGSEDLGGGLRAIFTLENGFGVNNGALKQNGRMFGRQAFAGLSSNQIGAITLGRQYDEVVQYLGPLSLTGTDYGGTQFAHPFDNDNLNNSFRINNSIAFQSLNYGGITFSALYGFSNTAGQFSNNRAYSFGASYNVEGLSIALAYLQLNNNPNAFAQAVTSPGAVAGDQTFSAARQRVWGAGVNYTLGAATAGFVFTQTQLDNAPGATIAPGNSGTPNGIALTGSARLSNYELNARYKFTPAFTLAGAYTYTDGMLDGVHPKWNQFGLQADYHFSKRTDVYLQGVYQYVATAGTGIGAYVIGVGSASSTNKQAAVTAGLRHRF